MSGTENPLFSFVVLSRGILGNKPTYSLAVHNIQFLHMKSVMKILAPRNWTPRNIECIYLMCKQSTSWITSVLHTFRKVFNKFMCSWIKEKTLETTNSTEEIHLYSYFSLKQVLAPKFILGSVLWSTRTNRTNIHFKKVSNQWVYTIKAGQSNKSHLYSGEAENLVTAYFKNLGVFK